MKESTNQFSYEEIIFHHKNQSLNEDNKIEAVIYIHTKGMYSHKTISLHNRTKRS